MIKAGMCLIMDFDDENVFSLLSKGWSNFIECGVCLCVCNCTYDGGDDDDDDDDSNDWPVIVVSIVIIITNNHYDYRK